jgi:alpha-glucoside transport system permease protein
VAAAPRTGASRRARLTALHGASCLSRDGSSGWQFLTAAAFISMIIPIVVFLSLQRYFVRGITGGAVKG